MKFLRFTIGAVMGSMTAHFAIMAITFKDTHMWVYFFEMVILMVLCFAQWALEYKNQK